MATSQKQQTLRAPPSGTHGSARMRTVAEAVIPMFGNLMRKNPGAISLGQGIVFYSPPPEAISYATKLIGKFNYSGYGPTRGLPELRRAIKEKLRRQNGIDVSPSQCVVVTAGSNMAFHAVIMSICDLGDEVILLKPYYFNHEMTITMCGCSPRLVATDKNLQPNLELIEQAINSKTRAVVTVSPNNPSARVYSRNSLRAISRLCAKRNIYHISDEAYEDFCYGASKHFSPASDPQTADFALSLFSLSKSFGFASWRVGYMVIPRFLLKAIIKVQDNVLICPPTVSQLAAYWCVSHGGEYVSKQKKIIAETREICLQKLRAKLSGTIVEPVSEGAFYIYLQLCGGPDDFAVARMLVNNYGVAAIPGSAFGSEPGFLRLSFGSLRPQQAEEAIERLVKGLKSKEVTALR